jgi:hypothetical protein
MAIGYVDNKVTPINEQISSLTSSLAEKASQSDVRLKSVKISQSDVTEEFLQQMAGTTPINTIPQDGSVTTEKVASDNVLWKKASFGTDTTMRIDFIPSGSDLIVRILSDNAYNNTFYRFNADGQMVSSANFGNASLLTYTVPNWSSLIWNMENDTMEIVSWNAPIPKNSILMVNNVLGFPRDGYLVKRYAEMETTIKRKADKVQVSLEFPESLYVYNAYGQFPAIAESNGVYFKFTGNLILYGTVNKTISFTDLYNAVGATNQDQSIEWVQGCIRIREGYRLVYDIFYDEFKVLSYGSDNSAWYIVIVDNQNGQLGNCPIKAIYDHINLRKANVRETSIPLYSRSHVQGKENEVIRLQTENTVNFAWTTDTHNQEHTNMYSLFSHNILNRIDKILNLKAVFHSGDFVPYGRDEKVLSMESIKNTVNRFYDKKRYFPTQGNHDTNGKSGVSAHDLSSVITQKEIYAMIGKHLDNEVVWGSKEYMYYYKDFEDCKIRAIFLNTSDLPIVDDGTGHTTIDILETMAMRQPQFDWLCNTALNFNGKGSDKSNWHTIVFSHFVGIIDNIPGGVDWVNRSLLHPILKAFVTGTSYTGSTSSQFPASVNVNFSSQGTMSLIGNFGGHCHYDTAQKVDGVNYVTSMADYISKWRPEQPDMTAGTYTEMAFDIMTVDKVERKVNLTRFGAGSNRVFNY